MNIFKLAKHFEQKLALGTRQAYSAISQIASLADMLSGWSRDFQIAAWNNGDLNPDDIYEEADAETAEEAVAQARALVNNIINVANEFKQTAYLYGMPAETASEYKGELLSLIGRLQQTNNSGSEDVAKLLEPISGALNGLEPQAVYQQGRRGETQSPEYMESGDNFPLKLDETGKYVRQDMPTSEPLPEAPGAGIAYKKAPPSAEELGMFDVPHDPSLEVDWNKGL